MKDPARLRDEGADDFELGLLASASRDIGADRSLARTLATLGIASSAAAVTSAAGATAATAATAASMAAPKAAASGAAIASAAGSTLLVKWIVVGALAGFATAGGIFAVEGRRSPDGAAASSPLSSVSVREGTAPPKPTAQSQSQSQSQGQESDAPVGPSPESPAPAPPGDARKPPADPKTKPSPSTVAEQGEHPKDTAVAPTAAASSAAPELMGEVVLLDRVRASLAGKRPADAIAELDRYRRDFPRGTLTPEATVLRIEALLQAGDRSAAAELAKPFALGSSPHATRIRSLFEHNP
jgi:hypothetical protein